MQTQTETKTDTITAVQVYNARQGKKFGKFVDQNGNEWMAQKFITEPIQRGQTITIEHHEETWGQQKVKVVNRVLDEAPRTGGTQAPHPTPEKPAQPSYRTKTIDESVEIFVCAMLPRIFQGTGQIPGVTELASMIYNIKRAWVTAMQAPITPLPPRNKTEAVPAQGFKTAGQAVPETLRKSLSDDLGGDAIPF